MDKSFGPFLFRRECEKICIAETYEMMLLIFNNL